MTIKEDFLYYIWQHGNLQQKIIKTTKNEAVTIISLGTRNSHAGPDFFNAKIRIGEQLWAGNVEMHIQSGHWFVHHHENDPNYDNVILHVVWEHDVDIYRKDNTVIPTLVLQNYTDTSILKRYQKLMNTSRKWIRCEADFPALSNFQLENWLERLYIERLEEKASIINRLVKNSNYYWEAVLFQLLAKGFGLKLNSDAFFEAASSVDFTVIRKISADQFSLEAFLSGIFGLLSLENVQDTYYHSQLREYKYLCHKFQLQSIKKQTLHFYGTRPANFPTIRTSQLATLYYNEQNLFSKIMTSASVEKLYEIFQVATSVFWETHYTYDKMSPQRIKKVSKKFIDVLLINSIIPLKYCYDKYFGKLAIDDLLAMLRTITPENNAIIQKFAQKKIQINTALHTQALLELKKNYCNQERCLQCAIGNMLVK